MGIYTVCNEIINFSFYRCEKDLTIDDRIKTI